MLVVLKASATIHFATIININDILTNNYNTVL